MRITIIEVENGYLIQDEASGRPTGQQFSLKIYVACSLEEVAQVLRAIKKDQK